MSFKTYVIAEAGVNHNGSLKLAIDLVDHAHKADADAIKFQSFTADALVTKTAEKARYQKKNSSNESQYEMLKRLELTDNMHFAIAEHCKKLGIDFISTPFDSASLRLLTGESIVKCLKVGSGEITNAPFLLEIAQAGLPVMLSTGMSRLGEIEEALGILAFGFIGERGRLPGRESFLKAYASRQGQKTLKDNVSLLHCTSEYPTPFENVNLRAIETLQKAFELPVGLSDHTRGISTSIAAVALGATIIEKHFTVDRDLPGPDHAASLTPDELKLLVRSIREVELSMGLCLKTPTDGEWETLSIVRKSVVASREIRTGDVFTSANLTTKRPANGIPPIYLWDLLGKQASRDYKCDEAIVTSSILEATANPVTKD